MSRANDPAFPVLAEDCQRVNESAMHPGLTLREYYAGLAMQGLLASRSNHADVWRIDRSDIAMVSRVMADTLLAELAKVKS